MKFSKSAVGGTVEILAADEFVAIPIKLTAGSGVVKAGTPISKAGASLSAATDAAGILLYDVDVESNPNAAIVVQGVIDLKKVNGHAGLSLTAAALKTALPGIVCRENIGVNA